MTSSAYPIIWALKHAPVADALERLVLIAMADAADSDGCNSYRSIPMYMDIAKGISKSTIIRCRNAMAARGLVRLDTTPPPDRYLRIPKNRRPPRWELCIPYSWWSDAQREMIQRERDERGLPPITPESRPDLAAAPPKEERADKGKKNPNRRRKAVRAQESLEMPGDTTDENATTDWGVSETPQESADSDDRGVFKTPPGVSSRHPWGCLQDTQPSFVHPPVKPSPSFLPNGSTPPESQPSRHNEARKEGEASSTGEPSASVLSTQDKQEAMEFVLSLPWDGKPSTVQKKRLTDLVVAARAAGWTSERLRACLFEGLEGAKSRYAVWKSRLEQLPVEANAGNEPPSVPNVPDGSQPEGTSGSSGEQKSTLVAEVRALRPEWAASSIVKAVDKAIAEREDPALVREAMLLVAKDRESQSPGRLAFDGPWWAKAAVSLRAPSSLPPRCDDPRHDPDTPNDRRLYSEDGKPRRCPRCHPQALAQGVTK